MPLEHYPSEAKDAWGEQVTIANGKKRREWFLFPLFLGPTHPLHIPFCGYAVWEPGVCITRKKSNVFAMELVTAGDIEFTQGPRSYLVKPGQLFFLRKGVDHSYRTGPAGYAHKRILSVNGSLLDQVLMQSGLGNTDVLKLKDARAFTGFVKQAMRIFEERKPLFMRKLSELAYAVLLFLADERKGSLYPLPVQRAVDHMYQHLGHTLSLAEVSQAAAASVPHLCRLFRQHTGQAPMTFFRRLKVQNAKNLLRGTTARVEEIARQMGYEDIAHFSHLFARETGLSPREFRKNRKN